MRTKGRTHLIYERSTGRYFANVDGKPMPFSTTESFADLYHPLDVNEVGAMWYGDAFQPILIGNREAGATAYRVICGRIGGKGCSDKKKAASKKNGSVPKRRFGGVKA